MLRRHAKLSIIVLIILFSTQQRKCKVIQSTGSILFNDHGFQKKCLGPNDVALLAARLKFQDLLPDITDSRLLNDEGMTTVIKYFYKTHEIIENINTNDVRELLQKSFFDMLGSFLKHQFLPLAKYSFYSGNITYKVVENISNLFERCKELLDTNGNDWRNPITDFSQFSSYIEPISLTTQLNDAEAMKSCACLATNQNDDNDDEEMIVPLPKMEIDEDDALSTIWLPLKRKHIFNINSKASTFILFRFFVTVSQCYKYQNIDQSIFNQRLKVWLLENISPYLNDDKLYPAFGGVLRIFKTIKGPNDVNIQINKHRKVKQKRLRLNLLQNNELHSENNEENLNSDDNYNNDLWIAIALAAFTTGVIIIIIYMLINCCCSNKKVKYSKPARKLSCMQKLINFFKHNTHQPDPDEFHTFSKKSSKQRVNFENEKQLKSRLKGKKKSMDRMKLPLLHNLTESEEDILEVNPTNKSWSGSSIVSQNDSKNQSKFRITESSEDEQETKSKSSKFLNKIRSLSPSRFRKQKS